MDPNEERKNNIALFIKVGVIVLSILMIVGLGIKVFPNAITVSNTGNRRDLPIYCVNTDEKKAAITFDVDRGNENIKAILDTLAKHYIKATFFMTGDWIEKYPEDVKAIAAAGHDLGNHSENHRQMSELSKEECKKEIMETHDQIKNLTGLKMDLFRAPYGDYDDNLINTVRSCGYFAIQWDVDSLDWKDYGIESIVKRCTQNEDLGNGSIILFHSGAKYTAEALDQVITGLKEQGYDLVPVSQLIFTKDFVVDSEGRQYMK